jgi:hypothetical protein
MLTKKFALAAASAMLVTTVAFAVNSRPAYAAAKVDCDAVMQEVNAGKHAKDIATDLNISTSSVYRCKRHAKEAAKAATKSSPYAKKGLEPPAAPSSAMAAPSSAMAAPSPAMAAPAAAASPK